MDSTFVAVAGIALLVSGVVGFFAVILFFFGVAFRYAVLPRLRPVGGRFMTDLKAWAMPPRPSRAERAPTSPVARVP